MPADVPFREGPMPLLRLTQHAARLRARRDLEAMHLDRPFDPEASLRLDRIQAALEDRS